MKKTIILAGVALAAVLSACTKEELSKNAIVENNDVLITYTVNDQALLETKSAYTPGTGVAMAGNEPMGVFYYSEADNTWNKSTALGLATTASYKATGSGKVYSFTAPAGTESLPWYAVVPYTKAGAILATGNQYLTMRFSPVQNPGANTFDPQYDILFSERFVPSAGSATINSFKRIFTPLCVKFTGLASGEKVYAASIVLDQEVDNTDETTALNSLAAVYSASFADTYSGAGYLTVQNKTAGNGVSALYSDGLSAVGANWPVWYMVHDMTIAAGTKLTATVTTGTATYTKTITFPAEVKIKKDQLNSLTINIASSAAGVTEKESVMVPFTKVATIAEGSNSLNASNGGKVAIDVVGSGSRLWVGATQDDSGVSNALNLNGRSFTIPTITGKNVIGVRVYTHVMNNYKLADASSSYLTLKDGSTDKAVVGYNLCSTDSYDDNLYKTGGYVDFTLPGGSTSMSGMKVVGNNFANLVSAVTFFTESDGSAPVVYTEASDNDLYTEFSNTTNKVKITINGVEYKNDEVTFYNDDLAKATLPGDLQKPGLHFISGTYDAGSSINVKIGASSGPVQYVSRYQNSQATISAKQIQPLGDIAFKNVKLVGANGDNMMPNNQTNVDISISLDGCTVNCAGGFLKDVNATGCYKKIVAKNCAITLKGSLYALKNKTVSSNQTQESIIFSDCTIQAPSALSVILLNPGQTDGYSTPLLNLVFTGNTLTNIYGSTALINLRSAKKVTITGNNITAPLDANSQLIKLSSGTITEASAIANNTFTNTGSAEFSWALWTTEIANITATNNTL